MSQPFSFYEDLRVSGNIVASLIKNPNNNNEDRGRDIQIVASPNPDEEGNFTLCHVPLMYDYVAAGKSSKSQGGGGGGSRAQEKEFVKDFSHSGYEISAATLLAIHHFNNGIGTIVPELQEVNKKCNVRITTEIFDTREDPEVAVKDVIDMISREHKNLKKPKPCGIFVSSARDVTTYATQVSSLYDIIQVSSVCADAMLDKVEHYPLFIRTNPTEKTIINPTVNFLHNELNLTHVGIISFRYPEGSRFIEGASKVGAEKYNMTVIGMEYTNDEELERALQKLAESEFNYFIGAMPSWRFEEVMKKAVEMNLAGPDSGKQWLFTETSAQALFLGNKKSSWEKGSAMDKACQGTAIIHNEVQEDTSTEKFYDEWSNIGKDQDLVDYINSKQPKPFADYLTYTRNATYFTGSIPTKYAAYAYDAVIAFGLSACASINTNINKGEGEQNPYFFSGKQQKKEFTNLEFVGASGEILFDLSGKTNSRNPINFHYKISNILEHATTDDSNMVEFYAKPVFDFDPRTQVWRKQDGRTFVFYDGTTDPPEPFPVLEENRHNLGSAIRAYGYMCALICILSSIACMALTLKWKKKRVIDAAQPQFLIIIAFGTYTMSLSIFFFSIDDGVASIAVSSFACMARAWTVSIGFCIVFAALYSKARRMNKIMGKSRSFQRVRVTFIDGLKPLVLILSCNMAILIVWTIVDPRVYKRIHDEADVDKFGRVTESYGKCVVKDESRSSLPYLLSIVAVNLVALVAANVEVYKGRDIETQYNEGKYIGVSLFLILQALVFGVPVLFAVVEYWTAMFFVASSTIFIVCMAILSVMFLPKFKEVLYPENTNRSSIRVSGLSASGQSDGALDQNRS
eukprot:CAMPEP_0178943940 /NCGR_PEP_ID=MMETSP0789-20121207/2866_1 /TAXON_ID=3005 /ORGANISM="Rhizosolenia setigera, Strain CCMP 1694" /LENGTH=855 /DNA_ID=CAMNT_0020623591 /DNA_START=17 /DNA_END=2584 /DNA_ORIENTATION=-